MTYPCPCDTGDVSVSPKISPGLVNLPRQVGDFASFRQAMLLASQNHQVFQSWRPDAQGSDLALMLLEMWAYISDVQAFYDEVIAQESYLPTARRRPSVRKHVALLGYQPRPAVASSVCLVVEAEGQQPVRLPQGMPFLSASFDDEAPQVFELDTARTVHPQRNHWQVRAPLPYLLDHEKPEDHLFSSLLLEVDTALQAGDMMIVDEGGKLHPTRVTALAQEVAEDGQTYRRVSFAPSITMDGETRLYQMRIFRSTQQAGLWKAGNGRTKAIPNQNTLVLDSLTRTMQAGQFVVLGHKDVSDQLAAYRVLQVKEDMAIFQEEQTSGFRDQSGKQVTIPAIQIPTTCVTVVPAIRPIQDAALRVTVYHGFIEAGVIARPAQMTIAPGEKLSLHLPDRLSQTSTAQRVVLQDSQEQRYLWNALIDAKEGTVQLGQGESWQVPLRLPATVYGNIVTAMRGATVAHEALGSGNAALTGQSFKLQKAPLTYVRSPESDRGIRSTLQVYVDRVKWQEVPSFYHAGPHDRVYTVHQNDQGDSIVTFGDGKHGARLPTGAENVVATYRYGAGAQAPPGHAVTQLLQPVKGVQSVFNPFAASGGADAEPLEKSQLHAPNSALLLGRVVSFQDVEAATAQIPGVRAARAKWFWSIKQQRTAVQIWFVGEASLQQEIFRRIRRLAESSLPIQVTQAIPLQATLVVDVNVQESYREEDVLANLRQVLTAPQTGKLIPENLGLGRPLVRSQLLAWITAVEGVKSVGLLAWEGLRWDQPIFPIAPNVYLDVERYGLRINGQDRRSS